MITDSAVVHVRMGQLAIGQSPTVLKTTLGSCVGIALLWRERAVYALAHCLLPYAPQPDCEPGGRYVDLAVISMLRMLKAEDRHHTQIEAHIAGGANMSRQERQTTAPSHLAVGKLNIEAAEHVLGDLQIPLLSRDVGGFCARQMYLDCATAEIHVLHVPAPTLAK